MHPFQFGHLPHAVHQPFGHDVQRVKVFAIEAVLQLVHLQIVEPLELHVGIGECLAEARLIVGQQFQRGLVRLGVNDELGIVAAGHLRGIGIHEARRRTAYETGDARDALVFLQHAAHRVGNQLGLLHALSLGQEDFHGKLVAVGIGEQSDFQRRDNKRREQDEH